MTINRANPYIWVTWVSKILAGEAHCTWASWKKAHFKGYETVKSDFNVAEWTIKHTTLLDQIKSDLEKQNQRYTVENQNKFFLTGKSGTVLSGKPDLVTINESKGVVIDAKTGAEKPSDIAQVQIYIFALRREARFKGLELSGKLVYPDNEIDVPYESVNKEFQTRLTQVLSSISTVIEPDKVPSFDECKYCNIAISECSQKIEIVSKEINDMALSF